jgi:GNAT superfamily N-acetyltransferase
LGSLRLLAPCLLTAQADVSPFNCAIPSLNDWLKRRAMANQVSGASRTYVVTDSSEKHQVLGYYCLVSGALALGDAPGALRRNMPDPIPMTILCRLAIDQSWQGQGLGVALLQDAVLRTRQAAAIVGVRGLLAHALSAQAKAFYEHHGFVASATQPMTLVLSIKNP